MNTETLERIACDIVDNPIYAHAWVGKPKIIGTSTEFASSPADYSSYPNIALVEGGSLTGLAELQTTPGAKKLQSLLAERTRYRTSSNRQAYTTLRSELFSLRGFHPFKKTALRKKLTSLEGLVEEERLQEEAITQQIKKVVQETQVTLTRKQLFNTEEYWAGKQENFKANIYEQTIGATTLFQAAWTNNALDTRSGNFVRYTLALPTNDQATIHTLRKHPELLLACFRKKFPEFGYTPEQLSVRRCAYLGKKIAKDVPTADRSDFLGN